VGLKAVAVAPDGIIEAIELPGYTGFFGLGVRWHPEDSLGYKPARDLFRAFVQAACEFTS
jgi:putative glutamine amidotransferase